MAKTQNNYGGAREGAGRPLGTAKLLHTKFREALAKKIDAESDAWMIAIKDAALGHYVQVPGKDGAPTKVYRKSPDSSAWEKAMDRAFGKAVQPIEGKIELGNLDDLTEEQLARLASAHPSPSEGGVGTPKAD